MSKRRVTAADLKVGDRLSARGRVSKIHERNGRLLIKVSVQGSRSPSLVSLDPNETITIYRKDST